VGFPLSARRAVPVAHHKLAVRTSPRVLTFWILLAAYAALTILVLVPSSPLLSFDQALAALHLKAHHPGYRPWINDYVMFGQRGPATLAFLPFFVWIAWRQRSKRPLVLLGTALVMLNLTVGIVKYATGRVGPMRVADSDVHQVFMGGNIYPSGHVSNAVVLYGLVAWIAPQFRKLVITSAVFLSVTVGLATIYLRTHWFSDVVGGWLAGALVLLSLPTVMPFAERVTDRVLDAVRRRYVRWRTSRGRTPGHAWREVPAQGNVTPVSASARSHKRGAVAVSFESFDEPTRVG
jgi:membrane-associated phospholipid phosphatase